MDVVSRASGGMAGDVFTDASSTGDMRDGMTGAVGRESAVAVTMTDTPSPALLTIPTPLSDGEGTGVEDSECGIEPSGW